MNSIKLIVSLIVISFLISCGNNQDDVKQKKQNKEYQSLEMQRQNKEKEVDKYKNEIQKLQAKKDSLDAKLDSLSN